MHTYEYIHICKTVKLIYSCVSFARLAALNIINICQFKKMFAENLEFEIRTQKSPIKIAGVQKLCSRKPLPVKQKGLNGRI